MKFTDISTDVSTDVSLVENPIVQMYAQEAQQEMAACPCDDCDPCDYDAA